MHGVAPDLDIAMLRCQTKASNRRTNREHIPIWWNFTSKQAIATAKTMRCKRIGLY